MRVINWLGERQTLCRKKGWRAESYQKDDKLESEARRMTWVLWRCLKKRRVVQGQKENPWDRRFWSVFFHDFTNRFFGGIRYFWPTAIRDFLMFVSLDGASEAHLHSFHLWFLCPPFEAFLQSMAHRERMDNKCSLFFQLPKLPRFLVHTSRPLAALSP